MGTRVWGLGTWGRETRDLRTSSLRSKRFRLVSEQRTRNESLKWLLFHFSRGQNLEYRSSVFLCSETKRKRLLRRLEDIKYGTRGRQKQGRRGRGM